MANVVSADEARVLVETGLNGTDLDTVIGYQEAWLARRAGQLTGERIQRIRPRVSGPGARLYLLRPTDAVEVTDAGVDLDPEDFNLLENGRAIERTRGWWEAATTWPVSFVDATYTPNDETEVKRVVIELLRLAVTETGMKAETIGAYSYTREASTPEREALAGDLIGNAGAWIA